MSQMILVLSNVDAYPGQIGCNGGTKSEIVCLLILKTQGREVPLCFFDPCTGWFLQRNRSGERISQLVADACG
ncbi:hypothetical protein V8E53_013026 [Lactarius tabidus]